MNGSAIAPDADPFKACFVSRVGCNIDDNAAAFAPNGNTNNPLGIVTTGYAVGYDNGRGIAPSVAAQFQGAAGGTIFHHAF